jgi:hypothetical protein
MKNVNVNIVANPQPQVVDQDPGMTMASCIFIRS